MHDLSNPLAAIKMGVDHESEKSNPVDKVLSRLQFNERDVRNHRSN